MLPKENMGTAPSRLMVVSFVGPSGSGKTTALTALNGKFSVLPEKYMELNTHRLDNRLMLSKWAYNNYWFSAVLAARANGTELLLTDRCPIDTCAYVEVGGKALLEVVQESIKELANLNIRVRLVLATAPFEVLEERILLRLSSEPHRRHYHEDQKSHNRRAYDFYECNSSLWENRLDTSVATKELLPLLFEEHIRTLL